MINITPKKLFLLDGIGAIATAFTLGVIFPSFEKYFGLPKTVAYLLSAIAVIFAIYSFTCFKVVSNNWKPYLKGIATVNLSYCFLTAGLITHYFSKLSTLAILYFVLELLIIIILAIIEFRTSKSNHVS